MSLINHDDRSHSYAVMQDNVVTNVIIALTKEIAEDVTGRSCVKVTAQTGCPSVGSQFVNGKFRPLQPYPSWNWSEGHLWWEAPSALPDTENVYFWSEMTLSWERASEDLQSLAVKPIDTTTHWIRWVTDPGLPSS